MTWSELVRTVAERSGLPHEEVKAVLDALPPVVLEAVSQGESVALRGICTVRARWLRPRTLRSIANQRRLVMDGRWVPRLSASSGLRKALMDRTPQRWRDPRHQAAWRLAEALVGDLDLYHNESAPLLYDHLPPKDIAERCARAFGAQWVRVLDTWSAQIPKEIREEADHLTREALRRWRAGPPETLGH